MFLEVKKNKRHRQHQKLYPSGLNAVDLSTPEPRKKATKRQGTKREGDEPEGIPRRTREKSQPSAEPKPKGEPKKQK